MSRLIFDRRLDGSVWGEFVEFAPTDTPDYPDELRQDGYITSLAQPRSPSPPSVVSGHLRSARVDAGAIRNLGDWHRLVVQASLAGGYSPLDWPDCYWLLRNQRQLSGLSPAHQYLCPNALFSKMIKGSLCSVVCFFYSSDGEQWALRYNHLESALNQQQLGQLRALVVTNDRRVL